MNCQPQRIFYPWNPVFWLEKLVISIYPVHDACMNILLDVSSGSDRVCGDFLFLLFTIFTDLLSDTQLS